jgi:hypothetical protein
MKYFCQNFLTTELIPSQNLSVFTNRYIRWYILTVSPTAKTPFFESCNGMMTWIFSEDFTDGNTEGFKPG